MGYWLSFFLAVRKGNLHPAAKLWRLSDWPAVVAAFPFFPARALHRGAPVPAGLRNAHLRHPVFKNVNRGLGFTQVSVNVRNSIIFQLDFSPQNVSKPDSANLVAQQIIIQDLTGFPPPPAGCAGFVGFCLSLVSSKINLGFFVLS